MKRSTGVAIILVLALSGGLVESSVYGQASTEYVSIRVVVEGGQQGLPVKLLREDTVFKQKVTGESGIADFSNLSQGQYAVEVPRRDFRETVEIDSRLTEVVVIPEVSPTRTGGGGSTTVETISERTYLYGILSVLLVIACGLAYLVYRNTNDWSLALPVGTGTNGNIRERKPQSESDGGVQATESSGQAQGTFSREASEYQSVEKNPQTPPENGSGQTDTVDANVKASSHGSESGIGNTDQYSTKRRIGAGGMSTVWLAQDRGGRDVALKVMSGNMLDDEDLVRKFIQEGKALDRINSTHPEAPVVQVYDYGYLDGEDQPYLALEYLEGDSLEDVIEPDSPVQVEQALPVIKQIAIALSAAHANDVYHRDVKPENVIIVGRGSVLKVRLIDFGVARHDYLSYVTLDGSLMGTPPYMSPEQGTGGEIDERSDIYALGALSYALLAGEPPFVDENPLTVLEMHQEAPVPPLPDRVPSSVVDLVRWMLEKQPEERPSQMWQVVGRIDELIVSTPDSK